MLLQNLLHKKYFHEIETYIKAGFKHQRRMERETKSKILSENYFNVFLIVNHSKW